MKLVTCTEFEERLCDLVAGVVHDAADAAALEAHAAACPPCAREARRERALVLALRGLADAPIRVLTVPDLATAHPAALATRRRLRSQWAMAAAACLVAGVASAAYFGGMLGVSRATGGGRTGSGVVSDAATARLDASHVRFIDDRSPFPAWDDRLLGLTAGAEHLAARRPAEAR